MVEPAVVSSLGCTAVGASECSAPPAGRARSIFARPKSRILAWPRALTKMLAGLRSRCTIPLAWADSSASAIWIPRSRSGATSKGPLPDPLGERLALQQLHRDEVLALVLVDLVDRADPGVVEGGGRPGLALETLERGLVLRHVRGQELERDVAAELRVLRLVHDAHAPAAELGRDPVVRDRLTDHRRLSFELTPPPSAGRASRTPGPRGEARGRGRGAPRSRRLKPAS